MPSIGPLGNGRFWCDCHRHCRGGKVVSSSTWYNHADLRAAVGPTTSQSGAQDDTDSSASSSCGSRSISPTGEANPPGRDSKSPPTGEGNPPGRDSKSPPPRKRQRTQQLDSGSGLDISSHCSDSQRPTSDSEGEDDCDPGSLANDDEPSEAAESPETFVQDGDSDVPENTLASGNEDDIELAHGFIGLVRDATLDNSGLDDECIERLRNPITEPVDVSAPGFRLSLDMFLATSDASEKTYEQVTQGIKKAYPEDPLLSHYQIKKRVVEISGVVPLLHDMCRNSCMAYTGPLADLEECRMCGAARVDETGSSRKFSTIPLGPQLQALFRSPDSAREMQYRMEETNYIEAQLAAYNGQIQAYQDVFHGKDYLDAVEQGHITKDDIVLIGSVDGAQLYRNKASDCWIGIWIVADLDPKVRFKKRYVLPRFVIGGPNKPKIMDSYLFPSLHHLSALQKEGLRIWNSLSNTIYTSRPFLLLETADGPGMAYLNGLVGHHGAYGCRMYCSLKGRRKHGASTYYPVMALPDNYAVEGCDHPDVDPRTIAPPSETEYLENLKYLVARSNPAEYRERRKATGISKPSIFSGLPRTRMLGVPGLNSADIMHWAALNWTDLFISLFRGTIECEHPDSKATWRWMVLTGDTWKQHGQAVADATPYLPGSFDRPPRNPAEKISSGYKAWEWLMYMIGLAPALLCGILPHDLWVHYCKGVAIIRCFYQRKISRDQLIEAHKRAITFVEEFETLYYQRMPERIHFVRQSIHAMVHLSSEVVRIGPQVNYAQWTMERTIGNLGEEIKQPSNPFANLSERASRRCQINALKAIIPGLDETPNAIPRGAEDLGGNLALLRAKDEFPQHITGPAAIAIQKYLGAEETGELRLKRWARLRLPNGQIARSSWKEKRKAVENVRMARNVKTIINAQHEIAEVHFYFQAKDYHGLALVSLYPRPDKDLLRESSGTFWLCKPPDIFTVVRVTNISAVVAMVPRKYRGSDSFFLVEKPGLEIMSLAGLNEADVEL